MSIMGRQTRMQAALGQPVADVAGERVLHPFNPQPRPIPASHIAEGDQRLAIHLLREGVLAPHALLQALARHSERPETRLADLLLEHGLVAEAPLFAALQHLTGIGPADLAMTADPRLIDRLDAVFCLSERLLPLRNLGHATLIAAADPEAFTRHRARLERSLGPILPSLAPAAQIDASILAARGTAMARLAETRVAPDQSCRSYRKPSPATVRLIGVTALLGMLALRPILVILMGWAILTLILSTLLKATALITSWRHPPTDPGHATARPATLARLPVVSVMVALYKESNIAGRLVKRLAKLDYPRECLDVMLVVEQDDHLTRRALAQTDLPSWMRIVVVPAGRVKTKPRALNFGLSQCKGTIVGVYDAEDAPEPDQIRKVVARFAQRGSEVACLQGVLDFYNPTKNWLARCFTIEYAGWFRVMLPGLERLGLPLPLGGTTLFFRREILERLGGWDAHNVTEDADLGIRLVRHGYRTEILPTTTLEEANCLGLPWVKQRSRWIKGYMMTYLTHMRAPRTLYRQLGPRGFAGFQILFLCSLSQSLLAPLLWSLWSLCLGFGHPLSSLIGAPEMVILSGLFMTCEIVNLSVGVLGLRRSGHKMSVLWVPTLMLYFPLQALAAYKALWEMLHKPFYWDKTTHGALH